MVTSAAIGGGAPATRDTDLLEPHRTVERSDAVVLSGGSVFGLEAGAGVQAFLRERGRGFEIGGIRVPLVCGASMFDLLNGGDKNWGRFPLYRDLGYSAAAKAGETFALGTAGGGFGATTVNLQGGLGSASAVTRDGHTVGALVVVNACGSVNVGAGPHFWAAPFEAAGAGRRARCVRGEIAPGRAAELARSLRQVIWSRHCGRAAIAARARIHHRRW